MRVNVIDHLDLKTYFSLKWNQTYITVLAKIQQKVRSFNPTFKVLFNNGVRIKMERKGLIGPDQLKGTLDGRPEKEARGNFQYHEYNVSRASRQVTLAVIEPFLRKQENYPLLDTVRTLWNQMPSNPF